MRLRRNVTIAFFGVSALVSVLLALSLYRFIERQLAEELRNRLMDMASMGAAEVEVEPYQTLRAQLAELDDAHAKVIEHTPAYRELVVAGIPQPIADHATAITHMALDMLAAIEAYSAKHQTDLSIRIGVHTGPVVAGVIGKKKFIYDLWGDTVNTASRMESHGVPGRVHITAVTAELIKGTFDLEARGPVDIKGKGIMETFLIVGARPHERLSMR